MIEQGRGVDYQYRSIHSAHTGLVKERCFRECNLYLGLVRYLSQKSLYTVQYIVLRHYDMSELFDGNKQMPFYSCMKLNYYWIFFFVPNLFCSVYYYSSGILSMWIQDFYLSYLITSCRALSSLYSLSLSYTHTHTFSH